MFQLNSLPGDPHMASGPHPDRRTFLATVGVAGAAAGFARPTVRPSGRSAGWDMSWLDKLTGKHKQVFDVASVGTALLAVANYLDAFEEVYSLRHPAINTVVGIAGKGFPFNATDSLWSTWKLGERYEVKDPSTGTWAVRNIFYDKPGAADTVKALQARGTIFWMCNNAINRLARTWAGDAKRPVEEVRSELIAGLNPGVILIPAHTMLLGLCQERGCTYQLV